MNQVNVFKFYNIKIINRGHYFAGLLDSGVS